MYYIINDDKGDDEKEADRKEADKLLSNRIRALRIEKGYSISEVARIIGINKNFLGNIERGDRSANYEILYKLSRFYDVNIDSLVKVDFNNLKVAESRSDDKENKEREILKASLKFLDENEKGALKDIINVLKKYGFWDAN